MILMINGRDMSPYIAYGGVAWQRGDVDGPNAGRTSAATMRRDRIAIKRRLDITCKPLTTAEAAIVLQAIEPEYVTVKYTDPMAGTELTKEMYSNNIPANYLMRRKDGTELWGGITFPLIER